MTDTPTTGVTRPAGVYLMSPEQLYLYRLSREAGTPALLAWRLAQTADSWCMAAARSLIAKGW